MNTQTNVRDDLTVKNLMKKLADEKIDHIVTILYYEYDIEVTQIVYAEDSESYTIIFNVENDKKIRGICVYSANDVIESSAEDKASELFELWVDFSQGSINEQSIDVVQDTSSILDAIKECLDDCKMQKYQGN